MDICGAAIGLDEHEELTYLGEWQNKTEVSMNLGCRICQFQQGIFQRE